MKNVLLIAASDPGGGAGIEADIKTLTAHRVNALTAMTAITHQDSAKVHDVKRTAPEDFARVLDILLHDRKIDGIKTGALVTSEHVNALAGFLKSLGPLPILVVDPVMVSTSGARLLDSEAVHVFCESLLPFATLITPNIPEAEFLTGTSVNDRQTVEAAARKLISMGARACLIKGGHMKGESFDVCFDGAEFTYFANTLVDREFHGTGCALASALTARLVEGAGLGEAVRLARSYLHLAMEEASPGKGRSWLPDLTVKPPDD